MKKRFIIILIVLVLLIGIPAVILANSGEEEEPVMSGNTTIPLIDTMKPALTETATFALG
jgi:Flp pilus assembly protein CpaB